MGNARLEELVANDAVTGISKRHDGESLRVGASLGSNKLLALLPKPVCAHVHAIATRVLLDRGAVLETPECPIDYCYFVETGLISIVAVGRTGREVDVAMIGNEGATGLSLVFGCASPENRTIVRTSASALRISAADLRQALHGHPSLSTVLLRFARTLFIQMCQTALSASLGSVDQRLARWILMATDRIHTGRLQLSHDAISTILGVRRAGVTTSVQALEGRRLISVGRMLIQIRNREGLITQADGSYGTAEAAYARMLKSAPGY